MSSHHAPHTTDSMPLQVADDIHYQTPHKQTNNVVSQPIYIQPTQEHFSNRNQALKNVHMPDQGHLSHSTSAEQHYPNYPYYYPQLQHHYHQQNMHHNISPHHQQPSMPIYSQPQTHPPYQPRHTAPHLQMPRSHQNTAVYAVTGYNTHDTEPHPPLNQFYQIPTQHPPNIAPHLVNNSTTIESKSQNEDKLNAQEQQPYKKIATPKTPPASTSITPKRKLSQIKNESNSNSRVDGDEDANSVDQALTEDSDSASAALSSDDSYEERRRKKKRRKTLQPKAKGTTNNSIN